MKSVTALASTQTSIPPRWIAHAVPARAFVLSVTARAQLRWRGDRAGNVLIYGAAWAGGIIAFVAMVAVATNKWVIAILLMAWNGFWYIVFYRNSQRKTSN